MGARKRSVGSRKASQPQAAETGDTQIVPVAGDPAEPGETGQSWSRPVVRAPAGVDSGSGLASGLPDLGGLSRWVREKHTRAEARVRAWCRTPGLGRELARFVPVILALIALIGMLRMVGLGSWIGLAAPLAAIGAYAFLEHARIARPVTVDLYRGILLCTVLLALASTWGPASFGNGSRPSAGGLTVAVRSARANIRSEPTTQSNIVTTAARGDELELLEEDGSWVRIRTEDGETGWIYSNLVDSP